MKKEIIDDDMPVGELTLIPDFLPPPHMLVFPKQKTIKITLELTTESIEYFKKQARKHKTKYQTMIRRVVDLYASQSMGLDKK
jgi:hypothetical protein